MNFLRNIKSIIGTAILFVITMMSKNIASALTKAGEMKFVGGVFKVLAAPFAFIAKFNKLFWYLLLLMLFFTFVWPILKTIFKKIGKSMANRKFKKDITKTIQKQQATQLPAAPAQRTSGPSKFNIE